MAGGLVVFAAASAAFVIGGDPHLLGAAPFAQGAAAAAFSPAAAAREHRPASSLYPHQRGDPVPMTTSRITGSASDIESPLPPARDKTFKIEAERRLRECEERLAQFAQWVHDYRGES